VSHDTASIRADAWGTYSRLVAAIGMLCGRRWRRYTQVPPCAAGCFPDRAADRVIKAVAKQLLI
jgi:hypothetical protein